MRYLALLLIALVGLAGCTRDENLDPLVRAVRSRAGAMPQVVVLQGELKARRTATVSSVRSGVVERVGVTEGDRVVAGQSIIWLHPGTLTQEIDQKRAAVSAARAKVSGLQTGVEYNSVKVLRDVQQAQQAVLQADISIDQSTKEVAASQKDMERKKQLVAEKSIALTEYEKAVLDWKVKQDALKQAKSKAVSSRLALKLSQAGAMNTEVQRTDLASAQANLAQAEADLASSESQLDRTILKSPITGVVINCTVEPGQLLGGGGESLLTVVDNSILDLFVTVSQGQAGLLNPHMQAELVTDLIPGRSFRVRLVELIPASDPKTNTVRARFSLEGTRHPRLMHGTQVRVKAQLARREGVLIPRDALRRDSQNRPFATVVRNQQTERRALEILAQDETEILVTPESVPAGEDVIISGGELLQDGTQVRVESKDKRL